MENSLVNSLRRSKAFAWLKLDKSAYKGDIMTRIAGLSRLRSQREPNVATLTIVLTKRRMM